MLKMTIRVSKWELSFFVAPSPISKLGRKSPSRPKSNMGGGELGAWISSVSMSQIVGNFGAN